jgi:hypothetical protein
MLTPEQRAELEEHGAASIRFKLTQYGAGRGASIRGFKCGDITRGDIEDWLAGKSKEETAQQSAILRWARIAGWAGIIGRAPDRDRNCDRYLALYEVTAARCQERK